MVTNDKRELFKIEEEYFNYHKHSHYSNVRTLDVVAKPEDFMKRAKELGHTAYFTVEHGYGGDVWEAYDLCKEYGLKCIYGAEVYYVDDRFEKERANYHLILIALNNEGFKDINRVVSEANLTGFYYKPRVDLKLLLKMNPKNVIVTTACVGGRLFRTENYKEEFLKPVLNHFGENFFLEVQCHNDDVQKRHNAKILALSKKYNIKIIHANDSHYIKQEDAKYRDLFLKAKGIIYEDESNFVLDYPSYNTILKRYCIQGILNTEQAYEALNNTKVFEKCEDLGFTKDFKIPKICKGNSNLVLKDIIEKEWDIKKINVPVARHSEYEKALLEEYNTIVECGMADYFILDYEVVKKAVNEYKAILTRSGRGSAVSFLTNKILGLTEVDRLKAPTTLYPSRFMTAERILKSRSLPDIDLNFASAKPVVKASKDILGEDGIYFMVAWKPMQESSAFRLWCKAQDMSVSEYNEIAKNLDEYVNDPYWGKIIEDSKVFRGVIESVSPSPCSYLLSNNPISEEVGLIKVGNEMCCCMTGYQCDRWKFLKNDYLEVAVYRLIAGTYEELGQPIDTIEEMISKVDESVWKLYEDGKTATLNQADSDFATPLIMKYKPTRLSELAAWVASIRPGFASLLNDFLNRKDYTTGVKELDKLLKDSFHYMLYQESIMKFLAWLGVPEKDTYDVIKHISKKKMTEEEVEALKNQLKKGWANNVKTMEGFDRNWQVVEDAVRYSFNASHALSVAIDSLYGAYLKRKHSLEYMTVALNEYIGDIEKTAKICKELDYFGITLKNPKFRYSKGSYSYDKETNSIYKGMASIKYLNENASNELYAMRDMYFNTFSECVRHIMINTSLNFRQLKILVKLNFFVEFGKNKKLLSVVDKYEERLKNKSLKEKTVETRMAELIEYEKSLEDKSFDIKYQIQAEVDFIGSPITTKDTLPSNVYMAIDIKNQYLKLYQIKTGEIFDYRVRKTDMNKNPFGFGNVLRVTGIKKQNKKTIENGEWKTLKDEYNVYISTWNIIL